MAEKIYCNRKWRFSTRFDESMINEPLEECELVNIPHTVKETPLSYFDEHEYQMISCYQKSFFAPAQWVGKSVLLTFEAIGHLSDVYVNGVHLATHTCGYTAFTVDVSEVLVYGEDNLITVRVDSNETIDQPPFGYVIDYMTYGGIYRDVYFEVKENLHINDVFVKPSLLERVNTSKRSNTQIKLMKVQGIIKSDCYISKDVSKLENRDNIFVRQYIDDKLLLSQPVNGLEETSHGYMFSFSTAPLTVRLWDIENPVCYDVKTELVNGDEVLDSFETTIGFRSSEFKANGYYLNGRKLKLRGLNRHQSYPYVGYAMPESMQRNDAKILKEELALNAVRTSHYPQSHYFLDECDKIGLLVFTEIPGWQHIGGADWKEKAIKNTEDMVLQYRNHPSIILWGVRINESKDDDEFYKRTNQVAHFFDPTRQTAGVRAHQKSSLLEDVYTYNDFSHSGENEGCLPKEKVTPDMKKGYLVSEYNGHMYPTKMFDTEEHRRDHFLRHARVLNDIAGEDDIAGSFGWCMFDYNTHKDFGSGDRICYHGVMDMFRNPKLAASVYSAFGQSEPVLEVASSFDIGEHPACNRGNTYFVSNADSVKMYKNDVLIKEYFPKNSEFENLPHGPILIDDFVGDAIFKGENFKRGQARLVTKLLNQVAVKGYEMTPSLAWMCFKLVAFYHMNPNTAVPLFNKYIGDWGGQSKEYKFEAIKGGKVVKTVKKSAVTKVHIEPNCSHTLLTEQHTYDVAQIRLTARDENDNQLYFFSEPISIEVEGPIKLIGPNTVSFAGGATGIYVKSIGEDGDGKVTIKCRDLDTIVIPISVECLTK